jgi:predicted DNA-binding transcriptional regulator AlpA
MKKKLTPDGEAIRAHERRREALNQALESGSGAFVRVHEAATIFGVSRVTVWKWARKGILPPATSVGGVRGWPARVIREAIERR